MKQKIRDYVLYQLRFETEEGNEELKEEIISNITDRFDEFYEKTKDENYSYIRAIKSMGDFTEGKMLEEKPKAYKPSIPEMFLISGVILAVFGLLIVFFSTLVGTIVIMLSIVSFAVGANYIYQESQYIKEVEFDIEKHNDYLTKIFSYIKTCFIFWSIGLSYILAATLNSVITYFVLLNAGIEGNISGIQSALIISIISFVFFFIILLIIFSSIYQRLLNKYYVLTGLKDLQSKLILARNFLRDENHICKPIIFDRYWFYPIINLLVIIIVLFLPFWVWSSLDGISIDTILLLSFAHLFDHGLVAVYVLLFMLPLITVFVLSILSITKTVKNKLIAPIAFIVLATVYTITSSVEFAEHSNGGTDGTGLIFIVGIIYIIMIIISAARGSFQTNKKGE